MHRIEKVRVSQATRPVFWSRQDLPPSNWLSLLGYLSHAAVFSLPQMLSSEICPLTFICQCQSQFPRAARSPRPSTRGPRLESAGLLG